MLLKGTLRDQQGVRDIVAETKTPETIARIILKTKNSEISRCNRRLFWSHNKENITEVSSISTVNAIDELERTIEMGSILGFDLREMEVEIEKKILGKGVSFVPQWILCH